MTVLVLTDPGSKIQVSKELFLISFGFSTKPASYVPAKKVDSILIESPVTITSGAFKLIREYNITVYWHDYKQPGMILVPQLNNGLVLTRKSQYRAIDGKKGVYIAKQLLFSAGLNRITALRNMYRKCRKYGNEIRELEKEVNLMLSQIHELECDQIDYCRDTLMGIEALIAKNYFEMVKRIVELKNWEFKGRSRRPAKDEINAMLNYGYAILKSQVTKYTVVSGLDIYAGFLHADRSGRESLILDLMEVFRQPVVDEVVYDLLYSDRINPQMFEKGQEIKLGVDVKKHLIEAIFHRLNSRPSKFRLKHCILILCRDVIKYLKDESEEFTPYRHVVIRN